MALHATNIAYRGRFAPTPSGPLHAGSLVAALASWLDARAHGGVWLLRFEDVDTPRCVAGADTFILQQLAACALLADEPPWWQSRRGDAYAVALQALVDSGAAYPCACTRQDIDAVWAARGLPHKRDAERVYPGTCRQGLNGRPARAWRFKAEGVVRWHDRRLGWREQDVAAEVGDFVIRRADKLWAYQLAVVVDDAAQGISDVVRGEDLADNTERQLLLQRALGLRAPSYLHTPLVLAADGHKLSKQNGAQALDLRDPVAALQAAGDVLGLPAMAADTPAHWLQTAVAAWAARFGGRRPAGGDTHPVPAGLASSPTLPQGDATMTTTASGLQYEDTKPGEGAEATAGQRVRVHYTGWLYDPTAGNQRGKKFDSSKDRGDPFSFNLGAGQVIRGWDEGVQGMKVGGTRVLTIPADLGYGARGAGGAIPPNAMLVFEVELLGV